MSVETRRVNIDSLQEDVLLTVSFEAKDQFLVFESGSVPAEIRLDQLAAITPVEPGAEFGRIELNALTCSI